MTGFTRKLVAVSSRFRRTATLAKMAEAVGLRRNAPKRPLRGLFLVAIFVAAQTGRLSIGHIGAVFRRAFRRSFVAENQVAAVEA